LQTFSLLLVGDPEVELPKGSAFSSEEG